MTPANEFSQNILQNHSFVVTQCLRRNYSQDILSDERVKLDLMFKMALSTDLVKGLNYIHRSAIEYHGNLTSSNCLVDDHWTLKLTDFGIRSLRRTLGDNVLKSGRALTEGNNGRGLIMHLPFYHCQKTHMILHY